MKYGYARVSTDDQNADMQRAALRKAGCKETFTDEDCPARRPSALPCAVASKNYSAAIRS
jgi:DNA invertase Pin-like site-specific DNA recombinase